MRSDLCSVIMKLLQHIFFCILVYNVSGCKFVGTDKNEIKCFAANVSSIIKQYSSVKRLTILGPGKIILSKTLFSNVPKLKYLSIRRGKIQLRKDSLENLTNLHTLEFVESAFLKNKIKAGSFNSRSVDIIKLQKCKLKNIPPLAFKNLSRARQAWITGNSIKTIRRNVFTNTSFQLINLRGNKIENIEAGAFLGMKNLRQLNLENNQLKNFNANISIGHSPSLEVLILHKNNLTELNKESFSTLYTLAVVNVSGNHLQIIRNETFAHLRNLWLVDLSGNYIEILQANILPNSRSVTHMYLQNNYLSYITPDVFDKVARLKEIGIFGNPWQCECEGKIRGWLRLNNINAVCKHLHDYAKPNCIKTPDKNNKCVYESSVLKNIEATKIQEVYHNPKCVSPFWGITARKLRHPQ